MIFGKNFKKLLLVLSLIICGNFVFYDVALSKGECEKLKPVGGTEIDYIEDKNGGTQVKFLVKAIESFSFRDRGEAREAQEDAESLRKKKFVAWMKSEVDFQKSISKSSKKTTKLSGNQKSVLKTKLKTVSDNVRERGSAYITGLLKVGQAIDMENMEACVTMVWTPALSNIATNTSVAMSRGAGKQIGAKKAAARGTTASITPSTRSSKAGASKSPASKQSIRQTRPGVKLITVKVKGQGADIRDATNDALKSAVSMVFGQKLSASSKMSKARSTLDVFAIGQKISSSIKTGFRSDNIQTQTKGLIDSYEILEEGNRNGQHNVLLLVKLPKYESSIDPNKSRVIVLSPRFIELKPISKLGNELKLQLVGLLNSSKSLTVLDRESLRDQAKELSLIASGNSPIKELARVGQTAGSDIMVITEIISLDIKSKDRKLGAKTIKRSEVNGRLSVKFIDVATTNIIESEVINIKKRRFKNESLGVKLSQYIVNKIASKLTDKYGFSKGNQEMVRGINKVSPKSNLFEDAKERAKKDW